MRLLDSILVWSSLLSASIGAAASIPRRPLRNRDTTVDKKPQYFNFTMPIDHFTPSDTRTYQNEYWVNDEYYKPGSPIFVYDQGEYGSTSEDVAAAISSTDGLFTHLLASFNGLGIAWQHRFYGYSQPFPLDKNNVPVGGLQAFQYMTQEQAMEDVVYFAKHSEEVQKKLNIKGDNILHPDKAPWIFIGGSYPGMRAALMRVRNPEIIFASWASSAPLQPDLDGSAYYNAALRAMPSNCTADFHKAVKWMDQMIDSKNQTAITFLQERISLASSLESNHKATLDTQDAATWNFTSLAQFLQRPLEVGDFMHNGPATLLKFCDYMETYNTDKAVKKTSPDNFDYSLANKKTARAEGIFDKAGPENTFNALLAAYVWVSNYWYASNGKEEPKVTKSAESRMFEKWGAVTWAWQNLHELGNFLGWSPDYERWHKDNSILSKYYTWEDDRRANIDLLVGVNPADVPPTSSYWAEYGGWGMQPSNVYWSDGEWDPWRAFSPGSEEYEMGKPVRNYTTDIPACGVAPQGTKLYGQLYTGPTSAHCSDLGDLSDPNTSRSVNLFQHALKAWLPCFKAK